MDYKYLLTLSGYIIFRYPMDKVSAKVAKEMYEHALKLETDFKHLISGKFAFLQTCMTLTYLLHLYIRLVIIKLLKILHYLSFFMRELYNRFFFLHII